MKYSLHAFMTINSLIDNSRFQDSVLGELSAVGRTYALDKRYYTDDRFPDVRLVAFRSMVDNTTDIDVPLSIRNLAINIGGWLENQSEQGNISTDNNVTRQAILAEFNRSVKSVELGRVVSVRNRYLPQFVEIVTKDTTTYTEEKLKIWFSDVAFKQQYPYHDIIIIPPIQNIDDFFQGHVNVKQIRNNINLPEIDERAHRLKDKSPYTIRLSHEYNWNDPENPDNLVPIPWTILVYGGIGNNVEIIKNAIVDHILKNSERDREAWEKIFPDLFAPTEFIIAPIWYRTSVPGYRSIASMYSPIFKVSQMNGHLENVLKDKTIYTNNYTRANSEYIPTLFKSIPAIVIGHPKNRLVGKSFYGTWPQYALIASRTEDFNRIEVKSQLLINTLYELLVEAERATRDDELLNRNLTKVVRDNVLYISTVYEGVQYLCVAKENYDNNVIRKINP